MLSCELMAFVNIAVRQETTRELGARPLDGGGHL
jgi:hypothetical protein